MAIDTSDIKLLKSERLTDEADGGGRATGNAVVDGEVNNVFPDISRLDRTTGRINLRKLYGGPMTENADAYLGAHAIVTEAPEDPRVSVLLFNTGSQTDTRTEARDAIESYVAAASSAAFELLGTQLAGQRALACVQREEQRVPEVGEVYQLVGINGTQYVRLTEVEQRLEPFVYDYGNGNFVTFTRRRLDLKLSGPLLYTFPGGNVTPAGTSATSQNGQPKAQVLSTQVADAARYYGISPLAEAVAQGSLSLRVQSVYSQLVPSTTRETALVDLLAGYQRQVYLPAGPARTVSLTFGAGALAGESRSFLTTGCAPGTLTLVVNGGTYADDGTGKLRYVSGSNWLSSGSVDYQTGEISLARTGTSWTGTASATYQPGAAATGETITGEVEIRLANRGYVYTLNLSGAVPRPGTLTVAYMALGRWYELRDFGDGLLVGEGAGTINFATGTVSVTLNALPDVDTSLVYSYVSAADNAVHQRAGGSVTPVLEVRHSLGEGVLPGSVEVTYQAGSSTRTLTDNGLGVLSGTGGTGSIAYASGELVITLAATPSSGITYGFERGEMLGDVLSVSSDGNGMCSFVIPGAPLKPGSVRASWMTTQRQAAPALNWDVIETGNVLPVYDGYRDISNDAVDNGAGGWQGGRAGTINYSTGACTLQVARLYDYVEYTYSNRSKGLGWAPRATEPVLVSTTVQLRETFGGTLSVQAQSASVVSTPETSNQAQPAITVNLLPGIAEPIIPGSLLFSWNGSLYCDRNGILYRDVSSSTNGGTAVGAVNYVDGVATLNNYAGNAAGPVTILACLTTAVGFAVTAATWRTAGAPLRPASLQVTAVRTDTAEIVTATADANGVFASGIVHGSVDTASGIVRLVFTTDPEDDSGESDVPVIPLLLRYNAVVQTLLPLDAGLLGLDPVRLPADGRVPIYREGDVLVIHHTAETVVASPTAGGTLTLDRQNQAEIWVADGNGVRLRASSYTVDREAGALTWANPLILQDEEGTPLELPLIVRDRVEHMTLCTEVQITGQLGISSPLPWDLPAGAKVSSAVAWGDLQARIHTWFAQQTWSQGNPNWGDQPQGNTTTAQYNRLSYPPIITNAGAIDGKWALVFTSATAFQVVEQQLGVIATGNTSTDCSPINPLTGEPYFTIRKEGWGTGWAAANAVRFNTDSALGPMWVVRTVISGQGTVDDDQFRLQIRGDAD